MTSTDTETTEAKATPAETAKNRAASLADTRKAKMDGLFKGKKYEVAREIHLEGEKRFTTPFGNKGRNGFALVLKEGEAYVEPAAEEGKEGTKLEKFIVGESMLKQIDSEYGAILEMPVKERKRRTKEQKAADDKAAAEEKAKAAAEAPADA